ncbi:MULTISPECIES: pyruvate kinase [Pelosinus]|uniref:Pyruvate kinase n=1 Tax=Pelosinus fermentans B4 TaxID=1149862 RepID=I9AYH3_9FIRM|nr:MULTISPECIES: pyruvate kinase [Pelosinus]EIW17932.1 pyruvate kinase [Pelosinus fermentans B4]EIW23894.1 pyruvate kinase [Pelosinus fermentans A11]OAM94817.1 pyruvate kinase [Pelosinus fermentans DSM 17108]SDR18256.1 pyruvate kinase [Pelosinus fermentans]
MYNIIKKTKIICTLGPSTDKPGVLESLLEAGMNISRFNFSHGSHEEQGKRIQMLRTASKQLNKNIAFLLDTKGPEIRLGKFVNGKVQLKIGQAFILTSKEILGTVKMASVNYKSLPQEVAAGNTILLSDGLVSLHVDDVIGDEIITTVQNSGEISDRKRVAVPGVSLNLPFLSKEDEADILFGVKQDMDFIAASFVQRAADIIEIRKLLEVVNGQMEIIAKIENAEGVKNIDEILKVADGIMVARGDLGVEIPAEEVPIVQKILIEKCNKVGKPVITATQMLESMMMNPRPTRAEASDIANAILDGTDCIMLSGETASGCYPVETLQTMVRIAMRTEESLKYNTLLLSKGMTLKNTTTDAISHATVQIAYELNAAAVITATEHGHTARMISKYRPQANIIAVTPHDKTLRRMMLFWGVQPVLGVTTKNSDEMVQNATAKSVEQGLVNEGDLVVVTAGVPAGMSGTTNMIRVHVVGRILLRGVGIGQRSVSGNICVAHSIKEVKSKFRPGDILVVTGIDEETAIYASKAAAIIAEEGGLTSNAAIVGISVGIPTIIGVDGAVKRLQDGMLVTVDGARGLIYQGEINAR